MPTKHLQLVSIELCILCRKRSTAHVFVTTSTPRHLWLRRELERHNRWYESSRVPPWEISAITWETSAALISRGSKIFRPPLLMRCTCRGEEVDREWWPESLREMTFGRWFNDRIHLVVWPDSLETLRFGERFNQSIERVGFPSSLKGLEFSGYFDQSIDRVRWPSSLQRLSLGKSFGHSIDGAVWPATLEGLTLGDRFNKPVDGVAWPPSLKRLTLGKSFDQPVDHVDWPDSLETMTVGKNFDQRVDVLKRLRRVRVYRVVRGWQSDELRLL